MPAVQKPRQYLLILSAIAFTAFTNAAESDFYQRFTEAKSKTNGFLHEISLVDTNNSGPNLTNAPIPFKEFAHEGELAGIKLGMTMSEVVAAWGKPRSLFTHCMIGPRFWYGRWSTLEDSGATSLSFRDDRLVLIVVYGISRAPYI